MKATILYSTVLLFLTCLALYLAMHAQGNTSMFLVLMVAAVIFWNRLQGKRS